MQIGPQKADFAVLMSTYEHICTHLCSDQLDLDYFLFHFKFQIEI